MIFNISPCASVATLMPQQNLLSLLSNMTWNTSFTIHMNTSCSLERKFTKPMKYHINVSSKQGIQKSTKISNTTTSSINIVIQIMSKISPTDAHSHQHFIFYMVKLQTSVPGKKSDTSGSSSNAETRAMYTGVLYQILTKNIFRSIGYSVGPQSKIYEDNQAKIRRVLAYIITPKDRPFNVLIPDLHEIHPQK